MYVYVPNEHIDRQKNYDVVVHIHGGSLFVGSPYEMVQPDYIMDKDVIFVTFNYRLGAAGETLHSFTNHNTQFGKIYLYICIKIDHFKIYSQDQLFVAFLNLF